MTRRELAATIVLRIPLDEVSLKVRAGPPSESADDGEDHAVRAGVVHTTIIWEKPQPSPLTAAATALPDSVVRQCEPEAAARPYSEKSQWHPWLQIVQAWVR